ncbi:MAG: hypothetical protein Q9187_002043 [Circinaria calcarea]
MATNRILQSKTFMTVMKSGKEVILAAATETQNWKRPESIADALAPGFRKAVEKRKAPLPDGTAKLIVREGEHSSDNDTKDHYTAVCVDSNGNYISTEHFPINE